MSFSLFFIALCLVGPLDANAGPSIEPKPSPSDLPAPAPPSATLPGPLEADFDTLGAHPAPINVRGVVRDANGSPIRGAQIRLMSETDTVGVRSDASGRFHARLTASRGISVVVRAYGYRDLARTFPAKGPRIDAALALPPPYPLGGLTVTALGLSVKERHTPATHGPMHSEVFVAKEREVRFG